MRDALKSAVSLSWATSLFTVTQMRRMLNTDSRVDAERSFDTVSRAASSQLGAHDAGRRHDVSGAHDPQREHPPRQTGRLDVGRLVVLGEGLAAGVGDFGLSEESQPYSFVAQAARQMGAPFFIPSLQSPGIYGAPGLPPQPVILPHLLQTTIVSEFPLRRRYNNLAIPGYHLSDCLRRRPAPPLVHRDDARQTTANFVLGLPALTTEPLAARPTQLEYALEMKPTLAIVELGFAEVLQLAITGNGRNVPAVDEWITQYEHVVRALRECGSEVVVATVPDPVHTAACLPLDAAARALRVSMADLQRRYGLTAGDCLTIAGLTRAAVHVLGGSGDDLEPRGVVRAAFSQKLSDRVQQMNAAIERTVQQHGTHLLNLHALVRDVRERGITLGNRHATADFLGGFYTLNGVYPGRAGHAVLANELLECLNRECGAAFPYIDVGGVSGADPVADYLGARGDDRPLLPPTAGPAFAGANDESSRRAGRAATGAAPLRLPPTLEMTVPLSRAGSYHGDAIRVVNCGDDADARFGSCAGVLFGGPALFDSHLSGALRIRFEPPVNDTTRFEVSFDPLVGDDGVLSAPMFFRWPVHECQVVCDQSAVSAGTLNLVTGEVTDLSMSVRYFNSALQALVSVNPGFPDQPIVFPGQYGSAWAKFTQRDDERLDFTFYGSTFLPLGARFGGDAVRWALPFAGASSEFASIPARGMALHPHLQLSTCDPEEDTAQRKGTPLDLPHNSLCELTLYTRRSSFGDRFSLNSLELGGPATGRSQLLGRLLVQTGEPFGGSLPVVVSLLTPGGLLGQKAPDAIASLFPGRLSPGPIGHDEHLRFPTRNYFLDAVTLIDDPFDLSVGAVDLRTGRFINQLLHRGFIGQDLFFSLIRVEPRTPHESFFFRGPAAFEQGPLGDLIFRLQAIVRVPYPTGFAFPAPDLTSAITVGEDSVLDPYLWLRAGIGEVESKPVTLGRDGIRASTGDEFSYRLTIGEGERQPLAFEYTNHAERGTFRLQTVSWLGRSRMTTPSGESDVFTFAGFGRWSKDPTARAHQVSVQIAVGAEEYVSIQIDSGLVSNVNTRPVEEVAALP